MGLSSPAKKKSRQEGAGRAPAPVEPSSSKDTFPEDEFAWVKRGKIAYLKESGFPSHDKIVQALEIHGYDVEQAYELLMEDLQQQDPSEGQSEEVSRLTSYAL